MENISKWLIQNITNMKRQLLFILIMIISVVVNANDQGMCGPSVKWEYSGSTLTISGIGVMYACPVPRGGSNTAPWRNYANRISEVIIEDGITEIGKYSFYNCSITSATIGKDVTVICEGAFDNCYNLTSIIIPAKVTDIGYGAFSGCSRLSSVIIPSSIIRIEYTSFQGCQNISTLNLNCENIGNWFSSQSKLQSITIGENVKTIDEGAFANCTQLTKVKVENKKPSLLSQDCFSSEANIILYVPFGSKMFYETADGWKDFQDIVEYIERDVNADEDIDILDVVDIARFVIGIPSSSFLDIMADINKDGVISIGDAIVLMNDIAGEQNFAKEWNEALELTAKETLILTEKDGSLSLRFENERNYTAFQFDLYVPKDAEITEMILNPERKQGHQLLYNKVEAGHYRVAALSTSNNEFNKTNSELLNITLKNMTDKNVSIRNIQFFDARGNDFQFEDVEGSATTVMNSFSPPLFKNENLVYDLHGRKREKLQKGVNIINDKKILF